MWRGWYVGGVRGGEWGGGDARRSRGVMHCELVGDVEQGPAGRMSEDRDPCGLSGAVASSIAGHLQQSEVAGPAAGFRRPVCAAHLDSQIRVRCFPRRWVILGGWNACGVVALEGLVGSARLIVSAKC